MKTYFKKIDGPCALMVGLFLLFCVALWALCYPPLAKAADTLPSSPGQYVTSAFAGSAYANTNALTGATSYTVNSTAVKLQRDRGISIQSFVSAVSPTAGTTNVNLLTLTFSTSLDGTTWSDTGQALTLACPAVTAVSNVYWTNWGRPLLDNAQWIRLSNIATTNAAPTNKVTVSYGYWNNP
jgi:hypothetical protein